MRYYGMTSENSPTFGPEVEEKPAVSVPSQMQQPSNPPQQTESQTFNRPGGESGIYKGQTAQNVTSVREWLSQQPPVVVPPATSFPNATIYEYPAGQRPSSQSSPSSPSMPSMPSMPSTKCQTQTEFSSHLCTHIGQYAYIELSSGGQRNGTIDSVGKNFMTLKDGTNHIMCPLNSISSIIIYNYSK